MTRSYLVTLCATLALGDPREPQGVPDAGGEVEPPGVRAVEPVQGPATKGRGGIDIPVAGKLPHYALALKIA